MSGATEDTARTSARLWLIAGLLLIGVSRLPRLLSPQLAVDGDEAIVGLMAKHLSEGQGFPLFFYGQQYGLSALEAAFGALFFSLFGVSTASLKVSMLALWTLGWLFLVLSVRAFAGNRAAWIAGALLLSSPAWLFWSMKARGGYLTAFFLAHFIVWVAATATRDRDRRLGLSALIGFCLPLLYFAQPLWLFGVAPFLVYMVHVRRRGSDLAALASSAFPTLFLTLWARERQSGYWSPDLFGDVDPLLSFIELPYRIWINLTGMYHYTTTIEPGLPVILCVALWILVLFGAAVLSGRPRGGRRRAAAVTALALLAVVAPTLIMNSYPFSYRYLLPLPGFLVMFMAIEASAAMNQGGEIRKGMTMALALAVGLGLASAVSSRDVSFDPRRPDALPEDVATERLIREFEALGIRHVYCLDPMYQWNLMFLSRERVKARWLDASDRVPAYPAAVDRALFAGRRVALVGDLASASRLESFLAADDYEGLRAREFAGRFVLLEDPPAPLLQRLGFRLNPIDIRE